MDMTAGGESKPVVRGQEPNYWTGPYQYRPNGPSGVTAQNASTPGSIDQYRQPMPVSGQAPAPNAGLAAGGAAPGPTTVFQPPPGGAGASPPPNFQTAPQFPQPQGAQPATPFLLPGDGFAGPPIEGAFAGQPDFLAAPTTDVDVYVEETRTGRFMFGVGVNSDAGVTGQIVVDERNFDITRVPTSFDEFLNGTAFRGGGQGLRIEAVPGDQVQRYLVNFTEPYLFGFMPISFNVSGFYFDRRYEDWSEQRIGGRTSLGYRLTHDLSLAVTGSGQRVKIFHPRRLTSPALNAVLGDNDLYSGRVALIHDTRDLPFSPTEGHYTELAFEQAFGDFDFPKVEFDYRKYFLMRERPDGSGRHTLSFSYLVGFTGSQTPVFENFYAGGFSSLRGFDFRGASPLSGGVTVGGQFQFLGSVQYTFPLTADDMIKGVVFCDYGTIEEDVRIEGADFRVAPGFGIRIAIPALGPAPLAFDFAFPVAYEDTDDLQNFSFFFGFGRL